MKKYIPKLKNMNLMRLLITIILTTLIWQISLAQINTEERISTDPKLMGIHFLTLKKGVDSIKFEHFVVDEFLPIVKNSIPGFSVRIMRGERNVNADEYIMVHDIQSKGIRDLYYPTKGVPSELTKEFIELCGIPCEKAWETFHQMVDVETWADYEDLSQ